MVTAIGVLLLVAGLVLLFDVAGAAGVVMRRVTSQPLGELAPGFAASRTGFKVYAVLILAVGVAVTGLGIAGSSAVIGGVLLALGILVFLVASVVAIAGEVRTYRALKS